MNRPFLSVRPSLRTTAILVFIALGGSSIAAEPKKKAAPAEAAQPASLRVWKGDFASKRSVRVTRRGTARKGPPADSIDFTDGYRFGDYVPVPPGAWTFEVVDAKEPGTRLATFSTSLAASSFSTLLVQEKADGIALELVDDTAPKGAIAELVVRNFAPTLKYVDVDAGRDLHVRLTSTESFLAVRGLTRTKLQVETSGEETSGQPLKWSNEVDFTKVRRATVLIYPDGYGRIRPRVVVDGEITATPTDAAQVSPK
jgi:hypothetical protein